MASANEKLETTEARNHLNVILHGMRDAGGFLELRAFDEKDKNNSGVGYNLFIPTDASDGEIDGAIKWLANQSKAGRGVFVGVNPRVRESGTKGDVEKYTTVFLDLDIDKNGLDREAAIAEIEDISPITPDLITDSGGGLHVLYFMRPTEDYETWRDIQETLYSKFQHLGADRSVVTDSSRILRLTPFPNWKYDKESGGRKTGIVGFTARERIPSADAVVELFGVTRGAGKNASGLTNKLPDVMPEGGSATLEGRNTLLFKEGSRLRSRGYEYDEILTTLRALNFRRCTPPLPENEVERIAMSAARYNADGNLGMSEDYEVKKFGYKMGEFIRTDFPPLNWIIYGLNNAEIGMINAIPNAGKTTLMFNLSLSMASGREFYPLFEGGTPRRVMYIDAENRGAFLQADVRRMMANFSPDEQELISENLFVVVDQEIYGAELNLANADHLEIVAREAAHFRADLIIIDTMAAAFTLTSENDNSEAERVVNKPLKHLARTTGAAILLVHHVGKAGETGDRTKLYAGRGASAFAGAARLVLLMESLKDGSGRKVENHVVLSSPKVKGKAFDDTVLELDFPRRWFEPADIVLPDETSTQETVWSFVTRPMRRQEIIEAIKGAGHDISDSTVNRALKLGVATGRLKKGITQGIYEPARTPGSGDGDGGDEILDAVSIENEEEEE